MTTAAELKARFPVFEGVSDAIVSACIEDAERVIGSEWREEDIPAGTILLAAHYLVSEDATGGGSGSISINQIKRQKLGDAEVEYHIPQDRSSAQSNLEDTAYGQRFLSLARRNLAGAYLTG